MLTTLRTSFSDVRRVQEERSVSTFNLTFARLLCGWATRNTTQDISQRQHSSGDKPNSKNQKPVLAMGRSGCLSRGKFMRTIYKFSSNKARNFNMLTGVITKTPSALIIKFSGNSKEESQFPRNFTAWRLCCSADQDIRSDLASFMQTKSSKTSSRPLK